MRKRARISLICLSCMVLLSAIRGGLFFSYYLLSPKEFTALFCENKANVQKHCDGKCFLAKVSSDNTQEQTNIKFDFTKHQAEVFWKFLHLNHFTFLLLKSHFFFIIIFLLMRL